jgi:hypothetical protein
MNSGNNYSDAKRIMDNKNIDFNSLLERDDKKNSSDSQRDHYIKTCTNINPYEQSGTYSKNGKEAIADHNGIDDKNKSDTKTDIIVKPDGSRVLVITTIIGGMESTMSLELSKPTNMLNEVKTDDVKKDNVKTDNVKTDDMETDEVETDEVKADEVKTGQVKTDEMNTGEVKTDDIRIDDVKINDVNSNVMANLQK